MLQLPNQFKEVRFRAPDELEKNGGIILLRIGQRIVKPNYVMEPSREPLFFLNFVTQGCFLFEYQDQKIALCQGDVFCTIPGQPSSFRVLQPEPAPTMKWFTFDGTQALHLLNSIGITQDVPYKKQALSDPVIQLIEEISQRFGSRSSKQNLLLLSEIYQLFALLCAPEDEVPANPSTELILQCKEFIDLHYMENISVKQVAAFAGLHWAYFSKVFHENIGTPPGQYVRMLRMNKAAELLAHSAMSVSEIASSLGFLDLYSFSRAFRNYYRVSPSFFRKQPFS